MMPGKGKVTHTGQLGDVMQESIQAAMTVVRGRAKNWVLQMTFMKKMTFMFMCLRELHLKMVPVLE